MNESKIYTCASCGHQSSKSFTRCPACGRWLESSQVSVEDRDIDLHTTAPTTPAIPSTHTEIAEPPRIITGIAEFDRVVGGGISEGAALLFTGPPGVGKSTLLMKIAGTIAAHHGPVLYVTAEESISQATARARRIGVANDQLFLFSESVIEEAASEMIRLNATVLVVDSLQLVRSRYSDSEPGSSVQVKEVSARLTELAKKRGTPILVAGQIIKTGKFAGPMSVPHLYDGVFHLDQSTLPKFILLRVEKNRFGSRTEVGSFRMNARGVEEIPSPSAEILKGGGYGIIAVAMEGTKPIATEIQISFLQRSDLSQAIVGYPIDRLHLIQTILAGYDIEIPSSIALVVLGGYKINDSAADLAVAIASVFASKSAPTPPGWAAIGEVALDGRLHPPRDLVERYREIEILGIENILVPHIGSDSLPPSAKLQTYRAHTLREALRIIGAPMEEKAGDKRESPGRPKELREIQAVSATTESKRPPTEASDIKSAALANAADKKQAVLTEAAQRKRAALAEKKATTPRPVAQPSSPLEPPQPSQPPEPTPSFRAQDPLLAQLTALAKMHPTITTDMIRRELKVSLQRAHRLLQYIERAG